jgi:tetratricopeptide (TPR) repeat protein
MEPSKHIKYVLTLLMIWFACPLVWSGQTPEAVIEKAKALKAEAKYDDAERHLRELPKEHTDNVDAHSVLAWVLVANGRKEEAAGHFRKVVEIGPQRQQAKQARETLLRMGKDVPEDSPARASGPAASATAERNAGAKRTAKEVDSEAVNASRSAPKSTGKRPATVSFVVGWIVGIILCRSWYLGFVSRKVLGPAIGKGISAQNVAWRAGAVCGSALSLMLGVGIFWAYRQHFLGPHVVSFLGYLFAGLIFRSVYDAAAARTPGRTSTAVTIPIAVSEGAAIVLAIVVARTVL